MAQPDPGSFADFYTVHFSRIAERLNVHLGDHADALAHTQEAFCRAFDRWNTVGREQHPEVWVADMAWRLGASRLKHLWAETAQTYSPAAPSPIQPPGVQSVVSTVAGRRARRRSILAAAMTAPLLFLAVPSHDTSHSTGASAVMLPPPPAPNPTPSRRVFVPGLDIAAAPVVSFVDASHGWAWYELDGRRGLGKTADGGMSWHAVKLPAIPPQTGVIWRPLGPDSVVLHLIKPGPSVEDELIVVSDAGTNSYPASQPPVEMLVAELGRYQMVCIDVKGCERTTLIKVGSGPVRPQPPLRSSTARIVNGADGRLWLADAERLFISTDNGKAWIEVQLPRDARGKQLKLSPDGKEAWIAGEGALLRFDGHSWLEQWSGEVTEWEPVGGEVLAVTKGRHVFGFVERGDFTPVAGISADYLLVLKDGTIVLNREHGLTLGVGTGADRAWTNLESVASVNRPVVT